MLGSVIYFLIGAAIGFISPRLPFLIITRTKGFNYHFSQHPQPISLGPYLTQRVILMRNFYWLGLIFALVPLVGGYASLVWGSAALGFGMWLSAGWSVINRLQSLIGGTPPPWSYDMAVRLQVVMNNSKQAPCCDFCEPEWQLTAVRCASCNLTLDDMARPDLGRKRSEGILVGTLRLLASDGYPIISQQSEQEPSQEAKQEPSQDSEQE